MIYLGKIGGPSLLEVLKERREQFLKTHIYYFVWLQGALVQKRMREKSILKGFDTVIKKLEQQSFKDMIKPIIIINNEMFFKVAFLDSEYRIMELMMRYIPSQEHKALLGNDFSRIIKKEMPQSYNCSVLNGAYK